MAIFNYHDGQLRGEGVLLAEIAAAVGTPVYIYSAARIRENVTRLGAAFDHLDTTLHYSLKANANLALIRLLNEMGIGMDAVSGGEIYRALQAGVDPSKIVFAGVGKTAAELTYALENKIGWFNVESLPELELLNTLASQLEVFPQVALRLNPEIQAKTHRHIATGHGGAKFGLNGDAVADILAHQDRYPHLHIEGLHVHIGSQLGDVVETVRAVARAQDLLAPYPDMTTLNIGGGFPVDYTGDSHYPDPETFAGALTPILHGWSVKLEPGRYIVADAGVLLTSVIYTKHQADTNFLIVDASMTELLRPALYEAIHPILPLKQAEATQNYLVVGAVCESSDVLHQGADLPALQTGDQLAITMAGAYGMVMASNYNQRPRPAEVLIEGDSWRVIRRRETWADLVGLEG